MLVDLVKLVVIVVVFVVVVVVVVVVLVVVVLVVLVVVMAFWRRRYRGRPRASFSLPSFVVKSSYDPEAISGSKKALSIPISLSIYISPSLSLSLSQFSQRPFTIEREREEPSVGSDF